jgi:hypothetical protein
MRYRWIGSSIGRYGYLVPSNADFLNRRDVMPSTRVDNTVIALVSDQEQSSMHGMFPRLRC